MPTPLDLSEATKLKDFQLRWSRSSAQWITTVLKTMRSETLTQITIFSYLPTPTEEATREWHELDGLLVQLWSLHSVVPKVLYPAGLETTASHLLPELTRRGWTSGG